MTLAVIALGSNMDQPVQQIEAALQRLAALPRIRLTRRSSCYRTAPVGYLDQPDFINAVCEVETVLDAETLLKQLLALELVFGRVRTFRNAPRVLDLDLLLMDGVQCDSEFLTLPHPRMHERAFVMLPLAEMAPERELSGLGSVSQIAAGLDGSGVERLPRDIAA